MTEPWDATVDWTQCLRRLVAQTPPGRVTTCGGLALALGDRVAARWVGHWTLHHEHDADCPCHRIVRAGGLLGGYVGGSIVEKRRRLAAEGVLVSSGVVDLQRFGFDRFVTDRPLERLRQIQESVRRRIRIRPRRRMPRWIGGVDVAYPRPGVGSAAYALVDGRSGELVWSLTVRRPVLFPYITSYLTFRELPILLALLDAVRAAGRMAEVLMVDGTGILHPRGAGIASHLGVVASMPTVGVIKKLLCGRVDVKHLKPGESRPVVFDERLIGVAVRPTAGRESPIFVSPGHRTDVAFADRLTRRLLMGRRVPSPVDWADRLSRRPLYG
ncbi:MAG: endonuclease V, partial [Thermoguttaceae bacterium]